MDKEPVSLWSDIKKYEDILAHDPNSYCFTILSEVYRKLGLLDDAIDVANRGIVIHPEYVGGYMAAGRAYYEKGMKEESKKALERVVRATPDNLLGQKLLSQIYIEQGAVASAIKSLQVVELLNPQDVESRLMLESLLKSEAECDDAAAAEDALSSSAGAESCATGDAFEFRDEAMEAESFADPGDDGLEYPGEDILSEQGPLATATLAELYVSQGFIERAVEVYEDLLANEPGNAEYRNRLMELKRLDFTPESGAEKMAAEPETEVAASLVDECGVESTKDVHEFVSEHSSDDRILAVLESWLKNIKRGRHAAEGDTQKYC